MTIITETVDAPNNTSTTYSISDGDIFLGTFDTEFSEDWLRVELDTAFGYYWTITGDGSATSTDDTALVLLNGIGQQITISNGQSFSSIQHTPTATGTFYLSAGTGGRSVDPGTYRVTMVQEVANSTSSSATIASNTTVAGYFEYTTDQDYFGTTLNAARSYYWTITGDGSADSADDTALALYDEFGQQLNRLNPSGSAGLAWTPTESGQYFISAG
ncbi:hypothetical protein, partial [Tateyamaria sp. ANG-S1]|uniref:hypothetical protein n=1 Tax=Tateyamaria sp. ANG-S1 TaxID=1577905 RepID=UPI001269AE54